jgi:hypothetical protein
MQSLMPWSERRWSFDLPVGAFLAVVERLAGTPARAAALLQGVHEEVLGAKAFMIDDCSSTCHGS